MPNNGFAGMRFLGNVVRHISDRVMVMYLGKVVEIGEVDVERLRLACGLRAPPRIWTFLGLLRRVPALATAA